MRYVFLGLAVLLTPSIIVDALDPQTLHGESRIDLIVLWVAVVCSWLLYLALTREEGDED